MIIKKEQREIDHSSAGRISIRDVSKTFRKRTLVRKNYTTIKAQLLQSLRPARGGGLGTFTALDSVSVDVEPGCSLGVIGRNGSGKSTLLKLISGIYQPDAGDVSVTGRISALIELGAGFHPEFSGRENVFLGGVMYGLTKAEIEERFDDIVRYAELQDYIDDPVKTYSSGMYMRLGFSLAVHTDPDILLIDEVLAVGDAAFIHRCHDTISEFRRRNKTLVFVTHDLSSVERWCDEALWLDKGVVKSRGEPRRVIDYYLQTIEADEERELELVNEADAPDATAAEIEEEAAEASEEPAIDAEVESEEEAEPSRWGNGDVEILGVQLRSANGDAKWIYHEEDEVSIEVSYRINKAVDDLVFGIGILRADGVSVFGTNTSIESVTVPVPDYKAAAPGTFTGKYIFKVQRLGLLANSYFLDVAAHKLDGTPYDYHHRRYKFSVRGSAPYHGVFNPRHVWDFEIDYSPGAATEK